MSREKNKTNKFTKWILAGLLAIAILVWLAVFQLPDDNLHLWFLDVGQGDSIYVRRMSNFDLLIDGGPDTKVLSELGKVMPFWDHKIDYFILTHPHADHLAGLIEVLKRYEIGQIIATDATHTSEEYLEWLKLIKEKNIPYKLARSGEKINLDNETQLDILWPEESYRDKEINELNNTSIVAKLIYGKFSVLFPGDAEIEVQQELLKNDSSGLKAEILKVSHHGSTNAANLDFLKAVDPFVTIISVGKNNQFGHPTQTTLEKLHSISAQIFRTDQNGSVEIISNGQTFSVKAAR